MPEPMTNQKTSGREERADDAIALPIEADDLALPERRGGQKKKAGAFASGADGRCAHPGLTIECRRPRLHSTRRKLALTNIEWKYSD